MRKNNLKKARQNAGLSQREAAERLSVSLSTYCNWEQGRVYMNGQQLVACSCLYQTTVDSILGNTNDDTDGLLSTSESQLLKVYRSLDTETQQALMQLVSKLKK